MQTKRTDTELIEDVLAGNQSAYGELVKRHQRFVFTLALRFSKRREDAEEISQDCFVKAYRSLATFQRTSKFSTWLYSIVYTTSMTFLRKKRLDTSSIDDEQNVLQLENHISSYGAHEVENRSKQVYVKMAIEQLLPDDASIITMFYMGELSLEEIAEVLHMTPNNVKVKLHRARHRLKERLEFMLKDEVKELI